MPLKGIIDTLKGTIGTAHTSTTNQKPSFAADWLRVQFGNSIGANPYFLPKDSALYRAYRRVGIDSYRGNGLLSRTHLGQNSEWDEMHDEHMQHEQAEQEKSEAPTGPAYGANPFGLSAGITTTSFTPSFSTTSGNSISGTGYNSPLKDLINLSVKTNDLLKDIIRLMNMEQASVDAARADQSHQRLEAAVEVNSSLGDKSIEGITPTVNDGEEENGVHREFAKLFEAIDDLIKHFKEDGENNGGGGGGYLSQAAAMYGARKLKNNAAKKAAGKAGGDALKTTAKNVVEHNGMKYTKWTDAAGKSVWRDASGRFAKAVEVEALEGAAKSSLIKRIAAPLIEKAGLATIGKSIPGLGLLVGGYFGLQRLMDGDIVGAGMDLAAGAGGPLTAIPLMIASIARDVYHDVYQVEPEADPLLGDRLTEITTVIKSMVSEKMAGSANATATPTEAGSSYSSITGSAVPQSSGASSQRSPSIGAAMAGAAMGALSLETDAGKISSMEESVRGGYSQIASNRGESIPDPASGGGQSQEAVKHSERPSHRADVISPKASDVVPQTAPVDNTKAPSFAQASAVSTPTEPKSFEMQSASPSMPAAPLLSPENTLEQTGLNVINLAQQAFTQARGPKIARPRILPKGESSNIPDPNYYGASTLAPQLYFRA